MMDFENIFGDAIEIAREVPAELPEEMDEFPPKLERDCAEAGQELLEVPMFTRDDTESEGDAPEAMKMRFGETVEERCARHALENAIEDGNEIAAEHRLKDYKEAVEEAAGK